MVTQTTKALLLAQTTKIVLLAQWSKTPTLFVKATQTNTLPKSSISTADKNIDDSDDIEGIQEVPIETNYSISFLNQDNYVLKSCFS